MVGYSVVWFGCGQTRGSFRGTRFLLEPAWHGATIQQLNQHLKSGSHIMSGNSRLQASTRNAPVSIDMFVDTKKSVKIFNRRSKFFNGKLACSWTRTVNGLLGTHHKQQLQPVSCAVAQPYSSILFAIIDCSAVLVFSSCSQHFVFDVIVVFIAVLIFTLFISQLH
jgi:hypothetical protein